MLLNEARTAEFLEVIGQFRGCDIPQLGLDIEIGAERRGKLRVGWRVAGRVVPADQQIEDLQAQGIAERDRRPLKCRVVRLHTRSISESPLTLQ